MTRLLDRYILGIFLPAVLMFTLTLLFLFISVDFGTKLGKFLEIKNVALLPFVLKYYLIRIPMFLMILIPAIMLFAPTFTIIKLARANEILPIATSGISLRRMSLPFVVAAILSAIAIAWLDEIVLPRVSEDIAITDGIRSARNFSYDIDIQDEETKLSAHKYTPSEQLLEERVRITRMNETREPIVIITAARCRWNESLKRWVAFDGYVEEPDVIVREPGMKARPKKDAIPPEGFVVDTKLTPKAFSSTSRGSFAPLRGLLDELERNPGSSTVLMRIHARFSFPLSPLVLLLVGLPFIMDPHSKSFIKGLILSFLFALGFYLVHFVCTDFGNRGGLPPVLASWFPIAAFGAAGLVAFARMKT